MAFVRPLYTRERRALLRCSLLICTGALLVVPLTVAPSFQAEAENAPPPPRVAAPVLPRPLHFPEILITHDPFIPTLAFTAAPVDNIATTGAADAVPAGTPVVRAVIRGTSAKALVDLGGQPIVVGIGSALAGSTVMGIDSGGIHLQNGQSFVFPEKQP